MSALPRHLLVVSPQTCAQFRFLPAALFNCSSSHLSCGAVGSLGGGVDGRLGQEKRHDVAPARPRGPVQRRFAVLVPLVEAVAPITAITDRESRLLVSKQLEEVVHHGPVAARARNVERRRPELIASAPPPATTVYVSYLHVVRELCRGQWYWKGRAPARISTCQVTTSAGWRLCKSSRTDSCHLAASLVLVLFFAVKPS